MFIYRELLLWPSQFHKCTLWRVFLVLGPWIVGRFPAVKYFATQKTCSSVLFSCCTAPIESGFGHLQDKLSEKCHIRSHWFGRKLPNIWVAVFSAWHTKLNKRKLPSSCYIFDGRWMAMIWNCPCDFFQGNNSLDSRPWNSWLFF